MIDFFYNIFSNNIFLKVEAILGVFISIFILILLFRKTSRDERGRAIIGKASTYSTIYFMVIVNVFAYIIQKRIEMDFFVYANIIQFIYNTVLLIQGLAIIILKRLE